MSLHAFIFNIYCRGAAFRSGNLCSNAGSGDRRNKATQCLNGDIKWDCECQGRNTEQRLMGQPHNRCPIEPIKKRKEHPMCRKKSVNNRSKRITFRTGVDGALSHQFEVSSQRLALLTVQHSVSTALEYQPGCLCSGVFCRKG
ncbi:stannin isoform X1 [Hypanus sabinus]|uniref:stannin isoform X1 n=1 Tax=Hypanus sabinus TaxID=79690 RepID=UPI0028C42958|nr:stannin isoform X1 [Hypanus sabinus]